jgi:hypothetical protein
MKGEKLVIIIIKFHKFTKKYPENWTIFKEFLMTYGVDVDFYYAVDVFVL